MRFEPIRNIRKVRRGMLTRYWGRIRGVWWLQTALPKVDRWWCGGVKEALLRLFVHVWEIIPIVIGKLQLDGIFLCDWAAWHWIRVSTEGEVAVMVSMRGEYCGVHTFGLRDCKLCNSCMDRWACASSAPARSHAWPRWCAESPAHLAHPLQNSRFRHLVFLQYNCKF